MAKSTTDIALSEEPLWYKDAVIYELHVRAFADSDGDGVGDFRGLTERLDYLQDLGVTALWLLPFYPSPLRDDGYDIADYTSVNPSYGTIGDFRTFLREAHRRGLRVITELVVNHTSDQHAWFQRARRAKPGSKHRDFYVWSDTNDRYAGARIIFKDFETSNWAWDPVARAYYWHRFYAHQPDLNFDNPAVGEALLKVMEFWLDMGVDGLRLDAVPYLYEREGTNCENLQETHAFLRELRRRVDSRYSDRMLLAEANQWPEDAIAYFGSGDECHMAFHFPLMPRLFMGVRMEDRFPIIDILQQTPEIPPNCQWALFLRNHDELTLEMVTDEERDYMYRVYAGETQARINLGIRRRLGPLLGNNRRKVELLYGILFSLPGTPVLYYGDEIGMGDNIYLGDRDSVRTPMQWSPDRNAGFSRANPQKLYLPVIIDPEYHYETVNVEAQRQNPHSLFWWMKRLTALRQSRRVFGRGSLEFLTPANPRVLAFVRRDEESAILIVANLSRFVQCVELDLSEFEGAVPTELFGRTRFPPVGELPYFLTLGPHSFYWLALEKPAPVGQEPAPGDAELATLSVAESWHELFEAKGRTRLERAMPRALLRRRWFGGKARTIQDVRLIDSTPVPLLDGEARLVLAEVHFTDGEPDTYQVPMSYAEGERADRIRAESAHAIIANVRVRDGAPAGVLYDAAIDRSYADELLALIARRRRLRGPSGEVVGVRTGLFGRSLSDRGEPPEPSVLRAEQSNTSILYGETFILKLYRRVSQGVNPDVEIGRYLTEQRGFAHTPAIAGAIEHRAADGEPRSLGALQMFVPNQGDGWRHALDALGQYFERLQVREDPDGHAIVAPAEPAVRLIDRDPPHEAVELIGHYLASAELLGKRTAELHLALAAPTEDPAFAPEPFNAMYKRSVFQSIRNTTRQAMRSLKARMGVIPESARDLAGRVLGMEPLVMARAEAILDKDLTALRTRHHGDYHLGQVLYTGRDFVIIDFEGEPARPLSERRLKRSPLRDVAGMLRSYEYAAFTAMRDQESRWGVSAGSPQEAAVQTGAKFWRAWAQRAFLRSYFATTGDAPFLPGAWEQRRSMLDAYLVEKAMYELSYELNNRPDWVAIPLEGVREILEGAGVA